MRSMLAGWLVLGAWLWAGPALGAEEAPPAAPPAQAEKIPEEGFVSVFNGKDLTGWDGNPDLWSVKDGAIRGETTAEKPAKGNTFCIWRGGTLKHFILKLKFRIQNGNSGVQYRSRDLGNWVVGGYQAEVCNFPGQPGFLYHEKGRKGLANVGEFVVIGPDGKKEVAGQVADKKALIDAGFYKEKDWNEYTIIARGNHIVQILNGYQTIELIDNDKPAPADNLLGRSMEGILALQIHAGPPMVVEFKDIRLRNLPADYGEARLLFSGKDLSGWVPSSDALKDTFAAKDGVLVDGGRPAGYLRTTEDFTNFCLWLQVRHTKPGNGGILVRMTGPDKVWPKSIECQGQSGAMGDIWNIDQFPMKVAEDRTSGRHTKKLHPSNEKPLGQWNRCEITLDGGNLELAVNGLVQNTATGCAEVPGRICLQAEGGVMEYRNIVLIPILRGGAAPAGGEKR
jgi:hypothetical protein